MKNTETYGAASKKIFESVGIANMESSFDRVIFLNECRFRNDGPPLYLKTNFEWHKDLLGIGEVRHFVPEGDYRRWGNADLYIWVDHGEDALPIPKFECPHPSAYWCSDSHLGLEYRLQKAKEFDVVFVAIPEHIPLFKEAVGHDKVFWLPHAGEPTCYNKYPVIKRYDVCFIGHLPTIERIGLIDKLFSEFPDFYYGSKFFEAANQKYNESKIVFNHCIGKEANMRVFEATLSGSLCLCSYSAAVEALGYKDGVNIAFYHSMDEMVAKARYYVDNDEERERIAEAGRLHTLNNHTYLHRAMDMVNVLNGGEPKWR